jgi:hypothetical protein
MAPNYVSNLVLKFPKVIIRGLNYNARGRLITSLFNPGNFRTFLVIESFLVKGKAQELEILLFYIE